MGLVLQARVECDCNLASTHLAAGTCLEILFGRKNETLPNLWLRAQQSEGWKRYFSWPTAPELPFGVEPIYYCPRCVEARCYFKTERSEVGAHHGPDPVGPGSSQS